MTPFNPLKPFLGLKLPAARAGVSVISLVTHSGVTEETVQGTEEQCHAYVSAMLNDYPANPYGTHVVGGKMDWVDAQGDLRQLTVRRFSSSD